MNYFGECVKEMLKEHNEQCYHNWNGRGETETPQLIAPVVMIKVEDGKPVPHVYCPICKKVPKKTKAAFVKQMSGLRFVDYSEPAANAQKTNANAPPRQQRNAKISE